MNGFELHGIKHVSYSSGSLFMAQPGAWIIRYLYKHRDGGSPRMFGGLAAEHGVHAGLTDDFADPVEEALKDFNRRTAMKFTHEAKEKERANIKAMVNLALDELRPLGPLEDYQEEGYLELEGVPVPVKLFTDFTYPGAVIDLKTTGRMPSKISAPHRRQGALYQQYKSNHQIQFLYVTPKKVALYPLEDYEQDLEEIRQCFIRMERFLSLSDDKEELANLVVPDFDSFYWNDPTTREEARRVFGY